MRALAIAAAIAGTGSPALSAALPELIAPAAEGKLQCYSPDAGRKTCRSIAGYGTGPNGRIDDIAVVLISADPPVTMETVSPVEVRGRQICGRISSRDIDAAKFLVAGAAASPTQTASLREGMRSALKEVFGKEICTTFVPDGEAFIARGTADGKRLDDQRVIWVSPEEGYLVGP
jgi:hypothetical protein